jgi:hypothetical protein
MIEFLSGAVTVCQLLAGLFFLRFWRRTKEPLFRSFAIAFWLLALSQAVAALVDLAEERRPVAYLPRLLAYLLILFAILRANLAAPSSRNTGPH